MKKRILIADDHALTREGIRRLLHTQQDIQVIAEAANGQEALELTQSNQPDVVVMDISMPELNGIQATQLIRQLFPKVQIVAQSSHATRAFVEAMFNAGALGYVLKAFLSEDLIDAIRTVSTGQTYLGTQIRDSVNESALQKATTVINQPTNLEKKTKKRRFLRFSKRSFSG